MSTTVTSTDRPPRNGVDVPRLFATLDAVKDQNEIAKFQFRATNTWMSGTHSRSQLSSFYGAMQEMEHKNVTVLDKTGAYATVYLNPDRAPEVSQSRVCANHQEWHRSAALSVGVARSIERQQVATRALENSGATLPELLEAFLTEPIYSRRAASPTVYSAVYRPAALSVDYVWPGNIMTQRIGSFRTGKYVHEYGELTM